MGARLAMTVVSGDCAVRSVGVSAGLVLNVPGTAGVYPQRVIGPSSSRSGRCSEEGNTEGQLACCDQECSSRPPVMCP